MGDRSLIVTYSVDFIVPIVFYGHWSGEQNIQAVRNVMKRTGRVGDASYLAAQLFYEFAQLGQYDGELSFGIDAFSEELVHVGTDNPTVYVHLDEGTYAYAGVVYDRYGTVINPSDFTPEIG
jgi:hypothetical protein